MAPPVPLGGAIVERKDGWSHPEEVVVTGVESNSQSERLGLKKWDVLVAYDGQSFHSPQRLRDLIQLQQNGGRAVELVVIRADELLVFNVDPGRLGVLMRAQRPSERR